MGDRGKAKESSVTWVRRWRLEGRDKEVRERLLNLSREGTTLEWVRREGEGEGREREGIEKEGRGKEREVKGETILAAFGRRGWKGEGGREREREREGGR
jgi:hypothetical protein